MNLLRLFLALGLGLVHVGCTAHYVQNPDGTWRELSPEELRAHRAYQQRHAPPSHRGSSHPSQRRAQPLGRQSPGSRHRQQSQRHPRTRTAPSPPRYSPLPTLRSGSRQMSASFHGLRAHLSRELQHSRALLVRLSGEWNHLWTVLQRECTGGISLFGGATQHIMLQVSPYRKQKLVVPGHPIWASGMPGGIAKCIAVRHLQLFLKDVLAASSCLAKSPLRRRARGRLPWRWKTYVRTSLRHAYVTLEHRRQRLLAMTHAFATTYREYLYRDRLLYNVRAVAFALRQKNARRSLQARRMRAMANSLELRAMQLYCKPKQCNKVKGVMPTSYSIRFALRQAKARLQKLTKTKAAMPPYWCQSARMRNIIGWKKTHAVVWCAYRHPGTTSCFPSGYRRGPMAISYARVLRIEQLYSLRKEYRHTKGELLFLRDLAKQYTSYASQLRIIANAL